MNSLRLLLALGLPILGLWFGSRWSTVAVPTQNVTVVLLNNETAVGSLARTWDNRFVLREETGTARYFNDFKMLKFKPDSTGVSTGQSVNWRVMLSVSVSGLIAVAALHRMGKISRVLA